MFSVCKDHVAEQAQSAPLYDQIGSKRSSSDNDEEEPSSKKKRQAHLLDKNTKNSFTESSSTGPDNGENKMNPVYTTCHLCDLHFTTEVDLEEHLYSLLHHRALEAEKGKDFVHECNLCCAKCKGLTLYVAHLREDTHKSAVDKRKEQTKLKPNARVYSLVRYKHTFLKKPQKKLSSESPALPSSVSDKPSISIQNLFKPTTRHASPKPVFNPTFHREKPAFNYPGIQHSFQPRPYHERPRSSPLFSARHEPWQYDPYMKGDHDAHWKNSHGNHRYDFGRNPYDTQRWWTESPHTNTHRFPWRARSQSPVQQPLFGRSQPLFNNTQHDKPAFAQNVQSNINNNEKDKLKLQDLESKPKMDQPEPAGNKPFGNPGPVDEKPTKLFPATVKIKPDLSKNNKFKQQPKKELKTFTPSSEESNNIYKKFRAVMEEIDHPVFNSNSYATTSKVSESSNSKTEDLVKQAVKHKTQSDPKDEKFRPRMVTFEESSKSSDVRSNSESSFQARLCESVLTGDLQEDDTSVDSKAVVAVTCDSQSKNSFDKQDKSPKASIKAVSPKTGKTITVTKQQTKAKQQPKMKEINDTNTEKPASASAISFQLDALAKKKQAELMNENCSISSIPPSVTTSGESISAGDKTNQHNTIESGCQSSSEGEHKKAAEMTKKKVSPAPNLTKARSRLSSRQQKTKPSTSDSDTEKKQTRIANMLLKYGTRPNTAAEHNLRISKKTEKRKLSGPRFGIGLVPHEDEAAQQSLDESDMKEIANTIKLVELTPDKLTKRKRSISEGKSPVLNGSQTSVIVSNQSLSTVASHDTKTDGFSQQLLQMSENEELLHTKGNAIKDEMKKLQDETAQVNSLIEQLLLKKQGLSEELSKVKQKEAEVNFELEKIRLHRLALLRGTVANQPKPTSEIPSFHLDACSHSTPMSSVRNMSQSSMETNEPTRKGPSCMLPSVPVKTEYQKSPGCTPAKDNTSITPPPKAVSPFPVASSSEYFDASIGVKMPTVVKRERSPSVDDIMQKYLQQASTERDVNVASATPRPLHCSSRKPDDFEVSSTTSPHEDYGRHYSEERGLSIKPPAQGNIVAGTSSVREKRNRISEDPELAKLDAQRPKSTEVTWSWVTAHNETYSSCQAGDDNVIRPQGYNTFETIADCTGTLDIHDASVASILVTESGWMVTCSKDKTVRVTNAKTGVVIKRFPLPHVPITAHVAMASGETQETMLEKIFIYVVYLEDGLDRTLLAESTVCRILLTINLTTENPECSFRQIKILEYNSSILCIHQSKESFLYLGARDGRVIVCNYKQVKYVETLDCHSPHAICCLTSGSDGARRILCCGSSDCRISVRDASDGLLLRVFTGHTKTVNSLQLVNNLLYSGSSDRTVLVHNIQTGEVIQKFLGMHGGSIKMLAVHPKAIITLCLDKCIRVLQTEPCRVSGPPIPTSSLPLSLHLFQAMCQSNDVKVSVPVACIGYQDGKVQLIPMTQLATHYTKTTISFMSSTNDHQTENASKTRAKQTLIDYVDLVNSLSCMWAGCSAAGFTSRDALLNHIRLFHAPDDYPKQLDSCCRWDNCTLYFSAELDSSKDVRIHMEKHVANAIRRSKQE
uniref:Uncharacterized protein LOC100178710 n=1 Tax=Phallusia mammillata TaxID=59560 RepID=A0A6F9DHL6_9ASCI|nr:uncharacterized protein LOC100178710 [Phallusia mammillata]